MYLDPHQKKNMLLCHVSTAGHDTVCGRASTGDVPFCRPTHFESVGSRRVRGGDVCAVWVVDTEQLLCILSSSERVDQMYCHCQQCFGIELGRCGYCVGGDRRQSR